VAAAVHPKTVLIKGRMRSSYSWNKLLKYQEGVQYRIRRREAVNLGIPKVTVCWHKLQGWINQF
jgi:hypothetical protein